MSTKNIIKKEIEFNGKTLELETGKYARLARSAVLVKQGQTAVLVTITSKRADGSSDYLPLRVDFEEKYYAGGLISGSRFTRREGMPGSDAIINARLIDHAIRPLFPKDFCDETQVVVTVLSIDGESDPALLGFLGTSAALSISGLPFHGPIVSVHLERTDGKIDCNLCEAKSDTIASVHASYTKNGDLVQAIEAEAHIIKEEEILEDIKYGAKAVKPLFKLLEEFKDAVEVREEDYEPNWLNEDAKSKFRDYFFEKLSPIEDRGLPFTKKDWSSYEEKVIDEIASKHEGEYTKDQIKMIFSEIQKEFVRDLVLNKGKRIDGRAFDEIRPLSAEVGIIDRVHGSGLFNRGETQALTITTLASTTQTLLLQGMVGEREKRYFHHYNFPPYSTGEVGRIGGANRRAVGHGLLAEKALVPVLPDIERFPYVVRIVSEILASNGSTSMASTCGSSLSLMDAGVPIKEHVAGIGIGLFVDTKLENLKVSDFIILTDILGQEDFSGYMDFKMTGTKDGVTAIQMELKLKGIPLELLDTIFEMSRQARLKVLDLMNMVISSPRANISEYAPKLEIIKIQKDQIGTIIGSGGATIKSLMEMFSVEINVEEKDGGGIVAISSKNQEDINKAKQYIIDMFKEVKVGEEYTGKVTRIEDYGAFVEILPKTEGLLHVSEYSFDFVSNIRDFLDIGDSVKVKVKGVENGKVSLTRKGLFESQSPGPSLPAQAGRPRMSSNQQSFSRNPDSRQSNFRGRDYRSGDRNNRGDGRNFRRDDRYDREERKPIRPVKMG